MGVTGGVGYGSGRLPKSLRLVSFPFLKTALTCIGLPESYVGVLMSVMSGPIQFCVGRGFDREVVFRPQSGIRQGDPLSPLLFNVVTVFLIYDLECLHVTVRVFFYADDILICLPGRSRSHEEDLRALLYALNVFGYFLGQKVNYEKPIAVVKTKGLAPPP